jgi:hypothetical protein
MTEIRKIWSKGDESKNGRLPGRWNFVMVDLIEKMVRTMRPRKYWNDLKKSLRARPAAEGNWKFQLSEKIGQLKSEVESAKDGTARFVNVADLETTLGIIKVPSIKFMPSSLRAAASDKIRDNGGYYHNYVINEAQKPSPLKINK